MLVINNIGPTKVRKVVLRPNTVIVVMKDGTEIIYRRVGNEGDGSKKG